MNASDVELGGSSTTRWITRLKDVLLITLKVVHKECAHAERLRRSFVLNRFAVENDCGFKKSDLLNARSGAPQHKKPSM